MRRFPIPLFPALLLSLFVASDLFGQRDGFDGHSDSNAIPDLSILSPSEASIAVSAIAAPMVVSVTTPVKKMDELRLRYLDEYLRSYGRGSRPETERSRSIGSGVIVSPEGYILTNNHVVDDAYEDSILVSLHDGRTFYADLIAQDPVTDLALLRIYARNLTPVRFSETQDLHIGEWVLAVGSPLGLRSTVTFGIVSALNREVDGLDDNNEYALRLFIQTDAAINPGNSGGGLFNLRGELVGINTAIYSYSGFYQGYGFAVPGNLAKSVATDLIEDGLLNRGFLGITARDVSDTAAVRLHLENTKGAIVDVVEKGAPADLAGMQADDVILQVDGTAIESMTLLKSALALHRVGETIHLVLSRTGQRVTVDATLGTLSSGGMKKKAPVSTEGSLGVMLRELKSADRDALKMPSSNGLIVESIDKYGTGALAGIFPGDVLLRIGEEKLYTMEGLADLMKSRKAGDRVAFTLWRNGKEIVREGVLQRKR